MSKLAQSIAGYDYVKVAENLAHKYLLHDLGKDKESFWSFHFHYHHKAAIKYGMLDPAYFEPWWLNASRAKEVLALFGAFLVHIPLALKYPYFVAGIGAGIGEYYYKHKKAHLDPEWALEHMRNHVLHHLHDQNKYWGVTSGAVDKILGTAPEISPEEWTKLRVFYMRRYNEMREEAEEIAQENIEEKQKNMKGSLERLTNQLYSFFERK